MTQRQHAALHRIGNSVRHRLRVQQLRQVGPSCELLVECADLHALVRRRPYRIRAARHDRFRVNLLLEQPQFLFLQQRGEQRLRAHRKFLHMQCAGLVHVQHQLEGVLHRRLRRLFRFALTLIHRFLHVRLVIFEILRLLDLLPREPVRNLLFRLLQTAHARGHHEHNVLVGSVVRG